jgi:hypothetical protein
MHKEASNTTDQAKLGRHMVSQLLPPIKQPKQVHSHHRARLELQLFS